MPAMSTAWFPQKARTPCVLLFTNDEGQEVVSDEFVFDEDCLNTEYTMALYLNQLDQGHVQANFSGIEGMEACSYPIQLKTGTPYRPGYHGGACFHRDCI